MNPYKAHVATDSEAQARVEKPRQFRWRIVPAVICWLIGGLGLIALLFGIANNVESISVDTNRPPVWVVLDIAHAITPVIFLGVCTAYVTAGFWWMRRRWISAVVLTIGPCLFMLAFLKGIEWLRDYAFNSLLNSS